MEVYLIQTKQSDAKYIWNNLTEKIVSNNLEKLLSDLDSFLSNTKKCNETLELIEKEIQCVHKKDIEVSLKKIFYFN